MLPGFQDGAIIDGHQRRKAGAASARFADHPIPDIDRRSGGVIEFDEFIIRPQGAYRAEFADYDMVWRAGSGGG